MEATWAPNSFAQKNIKKLGSKLCSGVPPFNKHAYQMQTAEISLRSLHDATIFTTTAWKLHLFIPHSFASLCFVGQNFKHIRIDHTNLTHLAAFLPCYLLFRAAFRLADKTKASAQESSEQRLDFVRMLTNPELHLVVIAYFIFAEKMISCVGLAWLAPGNSPVIVHWFPLWLCVTASNDWA